MRKRIIALVLSIAMILSVVPFSVFADTSSTTPNEIYLLDVPESGTVSHSNISAAVDSKYTQEDGENFISYKKKDGQAAGAMNGCNASIKNIAITYGEGATGLPEDSGINDFDLSTAYIAIRLKHKDNSPAFTYSNTSLDIRLAMNGTTNRITLTGKDYSYYWVDKKDGTKIKYKGASADSYSMNFNGDTDGYFLFPLSETSQVTLERLKESLSTIDIFFRGRETTSEKPTTWDDKELLFGDIVLVQDIEAFLKEKCPDYADTTKKYAPNDAKDSAYYGVRIGDNEAFQVVRYKTAQLSKTKNDPTFGSKAGKPYNHVVILPNGDRAVEFSYSEKYVTGLAASDTYTEFALATGSRTDIANLSAVNTYDGFKSIGSDYNYNNGSGSKLADDVINNSDYLAFRVATKGANDSTASNYFIPVVNLSNDLYRGGQYYSAYHFAIKDKGTCTYIDVNTGETEELTIGGGFGVLGTSQGIKVTKDLDGYILIPRASFKNTDLNVTLNEDTYHIYKYLTAEGNTKNGSTSEGDYTFKQLWGGAYYRDSGYIDAVSFAFRRSANSNNYWDPSIKFYAGDVLFVSDIEKFKAYHTGCEVLGHKYEVTDSKEPTTEEDGYITYTCQRDGCGDSYTDTIPKLDCLHPNAALQGVVDATCTEGGYSGDLYCPDCEKIIEEGSDTPALNHIEIAGEGKKETCTEVGYESSVVCDRCKETLRYVGEIPKIPHKYAEEGIVVKPTETTAGYTKYPCEYECGNAFEDSFVMPLSNKVAGVASSQIEDTMNIRVTWELLDRADTYIVNVYNAEGKKVGAAACGAKRTSVVIGDLEEGVYTVKVLAGIGNDYTDKYDKVLVTVGSIMPEPPVATVIETDKESLTVAWEALEKADYYYVKFKKGDNKFIRGTANSYIKLVGLEVDAEYEISICAKVGEYTYTPYGKAIKGKTDAYADIKITAVKGEDGITVSWDVTNDNDTADMYWVKRVDENGKVTQIAVNEGDDTSIVARDIQGSNTFYVIVRVKDIYGIERFVRSSSVATDDPSVLTYSPVDTAGMTDLQKAVVLTAENYYLRGNRIQYEDTRINATKSRDQWRWGAPMKNTLESYTSQNNRYSNCAAWTHETYWNALDLDIKQYQTAALVDITDARAIFNKSKADGAFDTVAKRMELARQVKEMLQPGDLVVYTRDTGTGHVMMYVGNDMMIHCTGSSYSWTNKKEYFETTGAIRYESCLRWFEEGHNSYLFDKQTTAIIRPLNTYEGTIPQKTLERMENMRGVVAEKLASVEPNVTVNLGDEITYTIKLSNYSDVDKTFDITDTVPEYTTYVSGAQNVDGDNLSWNVTVPAGKVINVSYTVKVSEDASALGKTVYGAEGKVGSISVTCHKIHINKTLTEEEQNSIIQAAESLKTSELRDIALADAIYKEAMGSSALEGATASDVLEGVFKNFVGSSAWPSRWQKPETTSNTFLKMLAPNLYGGRQVIDENYTNEKGLSRTRLVVKENLVIGDIIVTNNPTTEIYTTTEYTFQPVTYMFLGDKLLNMSTMEEVVLEAHTLEPLMCEKHFCIIRPSIEM